LKIHTRRNPKGGDYIVKKLLRTLLAILVLIALVVAIILFVKPELFQSTSNKTSEVSLIQDKFLEVSEWTTLKYYYSSVIISRKEEIIPMTDINYAETIKLIKYSGYLNVGTDLSKIQTSYNETTKKRLIKVPKSQIFDNVVITEETTVEDVKGSIFSDYSPQIVIDEINANKILIEEEKISQGLLEEADKRIQLLLTSFFAANGFTDVVVESY
jgi:hypothetical protein